MGATHKKPGTKAPKNKPKGPILNTVENRQYEVSKELSHIQKESKQKNAKEK